MGGQSLADVTPWNSAAAGVGLHDIGDIAGVFPRIHLMECSTPLACMRGFATSMPPINRVSLMVSC